ncbi:MAG TPA: hypothetical protein VEM34_05845 [Burkholderiales bacterium]|nr:hypothetical protein [Burkholderiales bacterium]
MSLSEHTVLSCTGKLAFISGPDDFSLGAGRAVDSSRMFEPDVSPYCFDLANRTLLCVSTPDISGATFFYQAQRQYARSVIRVPFESLPGGPASPVLIFSIGRCGSTLLVKALEAAGVRVASEPDFYTQAASHQPLDSSLRSAIAGATRLLRYSVVKLRLECNRAPLLIASALDSPRIMFILRDPVDWAASLRRLSRNSLDLNWAVAQLRRGLLALDELTRNYAVRICYYEDFRELGTDPVADALSWIGWSGTVSRETLMAVAARDAQDGTIVSRASVRGVPDDLRFREAFRREWSRLRPAELVARLQLKLV